MNQTVREFRVRPITRYVVTEWSQTTDDEGRVTHTSTTALGVFDNEEQANRVASALADRPTVAAFDGASVAAEIACSTLAERLKRARESAGISQAELGRRVGISYASVQLIEAGTTQATRYIVPMSQELGVRAEWLHDGKEPMRPDIDATLVARQKMTVNAIIKATGRTATALARHAKIAPSTLNRFLNGEVNHALSARTMDKIEKAAASGNAE